MYKQLYYFLLSLRPKQWMKNVIIFIPLVFSGMVFNTVAIQESILIFFVFSLFVGSTYIINDYKDKEKDKNHPKKQYRPLASWKLNSTFAIVWAIVLWLSMLYISYLLWWIVILCCFLFYLVNTVIYTFFLKKIEIIDIFSIAMWFVIRWLIGIFIIGAVFSPWLLIMLFFWALWLGFLKRYQEVKVGWDTRVNLWKYNDHFLEQIISMITTVILLWYALYTFSSTQSDLMLLTLPLVAFGIIRYYYNIFFLKKYEASIESIILQDKWILFDGLLYVIIVWSILFLR